MSYEPDMDANDNDMDRLLHQAFVSRPRGGGSPSLVDVRHRARRHQRRRVGGVLGATAVLGVSGVAALAARGGPEAGVAGGAAASTTAPANNFNCSLPLAVPTTTWLVDHTAPVESIPTDAPQPTYTTVPWPVGDTAPPTTTIAPDASYAPFTAPCVPTGQFRCLGNNGTDEQGYTYFEYCEPVSDYPTDSTIATVTEFAPTYSLVEPIPALTTTTSIELVPNFTTFPGVAVTTTDLISTTTT